MNDTKMSASKISIPKSVFHKLVREPVDERTEEPGSKRLRAGAVLNLQTATEDFLVDIFERTDVGENKTLEVEHFKSAKARYEAEVRTKYLDGRQSILDYDFDAETEETDDMCVDDSENSDENESVMV